MKACSLFLALLCSAILLGCEDEHLTLNANKLQTFDGAFKTLSSDKFPRSVEESGTSTLEISNGRFISTTFSESRGYGHAAGRLEITGDKIHFMDTVFKAWLMHVLPPKYLNGKYDYAFDGDKLQIGTKYQSGWVDIYTFHLKK